MAGAIDLREYSMLCIAQGIIISLILTVVSFSTWYELWGVWGILFDIFLYPLAVLAFPFVSTYILGGENTLFYYLHIFIASALFWFAGWLGERAEASPFSERKLPSGWLWLLLVLLTIPGGIISAIISQLKYKTGWWEFTLGGVFLLIIYGVIEESLSPLFALLASLGILVIFIIAIRINSTKVKNLVADTKAIND